VITQTKKKEKTAVITTAIADFTMVNMKIISQY